MAMISAIQEAQKDNLRSFNDYMMKVLEVCMLLLILNVFTCYNCGGNYYFHRNKKAITIKDMIASVLCQLS